MVDQSKQSSTQPPVRVMIIEDHTIVRQGLVALLSLSDQIELVGEASDGLRALELLVERSPDVVICDLGLPGLGGLEVIERAQASQPEARFIVLSMYHDAIWVQRAVEAGAWGYLVKGSGVQDLTTAILTVARGERYLSVSAQASLEQSVLSPREREVLTFVAQGHTSKEISALLEISPRTVEHHRARLMEKLNIFDVAGLTRYAIRVGNQNLK
jgi:DNA-binding NarL/FixJ family response regulator